MPRPPTTSSIETLDRLTRRHSVVTVLFTGGRHTEIHAGLIAQLRAAVTASGGQMTRGNGAAVAERAPIDVDALDRYRYLELAIRAAADGAGVTRTAQRVGARPEAILRLAYAAAPATVGGMLGTWEAMILAKLDPPRLMELVYPCPACGAAHIISEDGGVGYPLTVSYRPPDPSGRMHAAARCRSCGQTWRGMQAIRALAWDAEYGVAGEPL